MPRRHRAPHSPAPLLRADGALAVIHAVAGSPVGAETICLLTDEAHLPLSCLVIEGGGRPDDVFGAAELVQELSRSQPIAYVVLVSCRPGHGFEAGDLDRWHELAAGFADTGVELTEWFVRDERLLVAVTPLVGEVTRWPR